MRLGPEHDQEIGNERDREGGGPRTITELLADAERKEQAFSPLRSGETVEGTVAGITGDEVLVDLAGRSAAVLSLRDASAASGR